MIGTPAVSTLGALALHFLGPDHRHVALPEAGYDRGAPTTELPTPSLVHVIPALEPASSKVGADTVLLIQFFYSKRAWI